MEAQNARTALRVVSPRLRNDANVRQHGFRIARHQRRQIVRRAVRRQSLRDGTHLLNGQADGIEVNPAIAIDLQIDPSSLFHFAHAPIGFNERDKPLDAFNQTTHVQSHPAGR